MWRGLLGVVRRSSHSLSIPIVDVVTVYIINPRVNGIKRHGTAHQQLFKCAVPWLLDIRGEGTGTQPHYLANRADKKMEGPFWGKIARKSRNSRRARGGEVGAKGMVTKGAILCSPETKYKPSNSVFDLTSIVLTLVPLGTELLEISAQFLIHPPLWIM